MPATPPTSCAASEGAAAASLIYGPLLRFTSNNIENELPQREKERRREEGGLNVSINNVACNTLHAERELLSGGMTVTCAFRERRHRSFIRPGQVRAQAEGPEGRRANPGINWSKERPLPLGAVEIVKLSYVGWGMKSFFIVEMHAGRSRTWPR